MSSFSIANRMQNSPFSKKPFPESSPLELTKYPIPTPKFLCPFKKPQQNNFPQKMVVENRGENEISKYTYPIQMTNSSERECWTVSTDHCYARPCNWMPESAFLKPTKTLFMSKCFNNRPLFSRDGSKDEEQDEIDVESELEVSAPTYDVDKAKILMEECDKHAALSKNNLDCENWEDRILKHNWTASQHRLYNGFVNILDSYYLAKMAQTNVTNEPVLRRCVIDRAVQRARRLFATISYDQKLLQWLHQLLIENLDEENLSLYLNILQTLKAKVPKFVERVLNNPNTSFRMGVLNNENLIPLLKKRWDPVASSLNQDKPKKLPGNPVIVLMPCAPNLSKRNHKWMQLLQLLGHVVSVPTNFGSTTHRMTMTNCLDQIFALTRGRIQEVRENYPGRHIILVGVGAGATLALQIAQMENVFCVISLGFSLLTAEGRRGEPDDSLLELQCPALFVIGECSSTSFQEDMEDLRERMRVETGLIVVGSADNNLIISKKKKREEGITQTIVDRSIIDEVGEFISGLILSPFPPQVRQSPTNVSTDSGKKNKSGERKRLNSNTSSVESEPASPTPKITRPVGRPAGKAKCKLEAKWAAQIAQGTTSNSNLSNTLPPAPSLSPPLNPTGDSNDTSSTSETASATESPMGHSVTPLSQKITLSQKNPQKGSQKLDESQQQGLSKKIKTLKPILIGGTVDKTPTKAGFKTTQGGEQARMQAYNLSRNVVPGGQLSTLLQSGIKTIPPVQQKPAGSTPSTSIKVLENVQLSSQATAKLISSTDSSKLNLTGHRTTGSNVVLFPDGKIKTVNTSGTLMLKGAQEPSNLILMTPGSGQRKAKFITKRLQTPKASRPVKRPTFVTLPQPVKNFPPPTNLTTQDIMDLPIIFADDNQILDPNVPTDLSTTGPSTQSITKFISPTPTNKFVIVTKPSTTTLNNYIVTQSTVRRPTPVPVRQQPTKYTKIILSKKSSELHSINTVKIPTTTELNLSNTSTSSDMPMEAIDLETELVGTIIPKNNPEMFHRSDSVAVYGKKIKYDPDEQMCIDDDDPDYVPPKNIRL